MIRTTQALPLKFDTDVEISVDGGSIWNTLLANTLLEVQGTDIRIKSTTPMLSLDTMTATIRDSGIILPSINVKQAKSVTSLSSTFSSMSIGTLRVSNLNVCTTLNNAFSYSSIGRVILGNIPITTDARYMFQFGNYGLIDSINLPAMTDAYRAFYTAKADVIGDVTNNNVTVNISRMFDKADIKSLPHINVGEVSNIDYLANASKVYYSLHSKIKLRQQSANLGHFLTSTPNTKFIGAEFHLLPSVLFSDRALFYNSYTAGMQYPCSKIVKLSTNDTITSADIVSYPSVTPSQVAALAVSSNVLSIEYPDWLPSLVYLASFDTVTTQVTSNHLQYGSSKYMSYYVDTNGKVFEIKGHKGFEDAEYFTDTGKVFANGNVWYARNGWYATYDGTSVEVYNTSAVLQQTIAIQDVTSVSMSSDATVITVVSGTDVIIASVSATTTSQVLTSYTVATGTIIDTRNFTGINVGIKGTHQPDSLSGLCVLYSTYTNDGTKNVVSSSVIDVLPSVTSTTPIKTINTVLPMDYIHTSHREENEFYVREKATGKCEWYFAK